MTNNKKILSAKIAGISLLGFVMMFAAAAPSLTQAHAGSIDICDRLGSADWDIVDVVYVEDEFGNGDEITVYKCENTNAQCYEDDGDGIPELGGDDAAIGFVPLKSETSTWCANTTGAIMISDDPNAILSDSIPAEWNFVSGTEVAGSCDADVKGFSGKGATVIECTTQPSDVGNVAAFTVDLIETRESPGKGHKDPITKEPITVYKPTSCSLDVNGGASGFVPDRTFNDDGDDGTTPEVPFETEQTLSVPITVGCI